MGGGASPAVVAVNVIQSDTEFWATRELTPGGPYTANKRGLASAITVTVSNIKAQSCLMTITNPTTGRAFLEKLTLRGQPLPAEDEEESWAGDPDGAQVLTFPSNYYFQSATQAQALADAALARYQANRRTVELSGVPAQPHVRAAALVRVVAAEQGIARNFVVMGKDWVYSPGEGYREKYLLADAANFASYQDYFIVGTSALGPAGSPGAARLWH